ncbi:LLM class flavin-dependent oxidoreductase [Amycolatopsis sp. CA-161197]|uniref:LLM class flavin-dependent oxidoreductase n=1 Tax=unclassified Amycolatopsis TaxID=2618356 RepID=UPI00368D8E94
MSGAEPRLLLNLARPHGVLDHLAAARTALGDGVDGVGFADSPRLFPDPFLTAGQVLTRTTAALSGPCVMGLGLHHPSVVAQALATLAGQHPGRTLLAVARGESSLRNEGLPIPSLSSYRVLLEQLRARLDELSAQLPGGFGPVLGAASGPRTIEQTSAILGGVLLDVGVEPAVIERAVGIARARRPDVRCWLFLRAVVTDTDDEAAAGAAPILGSCAARITKSPDWYGIAPELVARVAAVASAHDYRRHGTSESAGARDADPEIDSLIRDRFVLTGDPAALAARLRPLATLGIEGVVIAGATAGVERRLAQTAGALRAGLATAQPAS